MSDGKASVDWAFVCDYALIDAGGKLSIIGVFDRLFAATFPAVHPVLYIVASWSGPPGESHVVELRCWSPGEELIGSMQQQVLFGPDGRSTGIFQLPQMPIPAPGDYIFELLAGEVSAKHLPLTVVPAEQS